MPVWAWGLAGLFSLCLVVVTLAVLAFRDRETQWTDSKFVRFVGLTLLKACAAMIAVSTIILMLLPGDPA